MRTPISLILSAAIVFPLGGCASYHRYLPTPSERAIMESTGLSGNPQKWDKKKVLQSAERVQHDALLVTDLDATMFAAKVRDLLRTKATVSRIAREVSATTEVMAAAAAAALAAVTGGSTKAVTILAGSAAVIPNLQSVFTAKERAEGYNQGATLVADAEGRYLAAVHGEISRSTLTQHGAHLIEETIATLKLVETAIISQIPDVGDVQKAKGLRVQAFALSQDTVQFASSNPGDQGEIVTTDGSSLSEALTENAGVAEGTISGTKAVITPKGAGITRIRLVNSARKVADVTVEVLLQVDATIPRTIERSDRGWIMHKNDEITLAWSNANGADIEIEQSPKAILKVTRAADGKSAVFKAEEVGQVKVLLKSPRGARRAYDMTVKTD